MPTIHATGNVAKPKIVSVEGADIKDGLEIASAKDVTYPAVWHKGQRLYDVEVWLDEELVVTVPPRSEQVDASFDEHERRRGS
jgi:hypothetical protein